MKKERCLYPFAAGDNGDGDDVLTIKSPRTGKFSNVPFNQFPNKSASNSGLALLHELTA
jgi:hypothetical protein